MGRFWTGRSERDKSCLPWLQSPRRGAEPPIARKTADSVRLRVNVLRDLYESASRVLQIIILSIELQKPEGIEIGRRKILEGMIPFAVFPVTRLDKIEIVGSVYERHGPILHS
jgi:hypothetical protein